MEAAKGTKKQISIQPLVPCNTCSGSGLKEGAKRTTCKACGGNGSKLRFLPGGFQIASTCDSCGGSGLAVPRGSECGGCRGDGVQREKKVVTVDIPAGVDDGMRIKIQGEGDAPVQTMPGSSAKIARGDLYVFIRVLPHSQFKRNGTDLLYTAKIPVTTALLGGQIKVPTLDGDVELRVHTGTSSGKKIVMNGYGLPKVNKYGRPGSKGDLEIEFKVEMPA
jgi:molecular chaperone DnaJ